MNRNAYFVTKSKEKLIKEEDYYFDQNGRMVFTEAYHIKRGFCCKNDCKHCPYNFIK